MKKTVEASAPKTKGNIHEGCGGQVFASSQGRKCLKCGELLGGQKIFVSREPQHAAKIEQIAAGPAHFVDRGGGPLHNVASAR